MPYAGSDQTGFALGIMTTVSEIGDFNGDGINDFVVGSPYEAGELGGNAFVIYGTPDGLPRSLDLDNLDPSEGVAIVGGDAGTLFQTGDLLGYDVRDAGDINGDGFDDVVVGAPQDDPTYTYTNSFLTYVGYSSYVVTYTGFNYYGYGTYTTYGAYTYIYTGTYTFTSGYTNFGGYSTYVTYTYTNTRNDAGSAYVIYGTNTNPTAVDVNPLGSSGLQVTGPTSGSNLGLQVTGVGDFNGDGVDDVAASAESFFGGSYSTYFYTDGAVFVVFGDAGSLPDSVDTNTLPSPEGTVLVTNQTNSNFGAALDGGQDINGDGFGDIAVGAPNAYASYVVTNTYTYTIPPSGYSTYIYTGGGYSVGYTTYSGAYTYTSYIPPFGYFTYVYTQPGGTYTYTNTYVTYVPNTGAAYVFFGNTGGIVPPAVALLPSGVINENSLVGSNGFTFNGTTTGDQVGADVAFIGDVNGDGLDDVMIGAPGADGGAGEAYVVFGSALGFPAELNRTDLNGTNGFIIQGDGFGIGLGQTVAGVGDVNGDGIDDFAVVDTETYLGENDIHVFFGTDAALPPVISTADLDGTNGFSIQQFDGALNFGQSVAGADLNADGFSDIIASTNNASNVLMGGMEVLGFLDALDGFADGRIDADFLFDPFVVGTGSDDVLGSSNDSSQMFGLSGNDDMTGGTSADLISGGDGNDSLNGGGANDTLEGGRNNDDLRGGFGDDLLRGEGGSDTIRGNAGDDVINAEAGNDVAYGQSGNDTITGGGQNDYLDGGNDDDLIRGGNGSDTVIGGDGDDRLIGDAGADLIEGGTGNDNIFGGNGLDTIIGGEGDDVMRGEGQFDVFVFADGFGNDRIVDFDEFSSGEQIDLSAVTSITDFADLAANHMSQIGSWVQIDAGGGNTIRVDNALVADMTADDFIF